MALKNLFDMVKADRYTADGREALIKAQEAETEDKVYQIGEISQKTGLQKTANGWVKPPRNKEIQNAGKHAESVKAAQKAKKEEARRQQRAEGEANARAFQEKVEKGEIKPDGAEVHQQQGEEIKANLETAKYYFDKAQSFSPTDPSYKTYMTKAKQYNDEAKAQADDNGFDFEEMHNSGITQAVNEYAEEQSKSAAETKPETTAKFETEQENAKYEEGRKGWETVSKERLPDIKKKVEQKIDYYKKYDPYAMLGKRTGLNAAQKKAVEQNMAQAKENLAFFTGQLEGINEQMGASDSAPRVLTGDTRIRVRKA